MNIANDKPLIAPYGVNQEGSSDMYNKGAALIHTIRQVIDDDTLFRDILRGLNKDFYHQTVNTSDIENYISKHSKKDLSKIFDQYLRTTKIPVLEYKFTGDRMSYRWTNSVEGFKMPVKLKDGEWLKPCSDWESVTVGSDILKNGLEPDLNFYIKVKKVS